VDIRRSALVIVAIGSMVCLSACGRSEKPAIQPHLGSGTPAVPTIARKVPIPVVTTTSPSMAPAPWPDKTLAPVAGPGALNAADNDAYSLVSETTTPEQGPYRLERTDLTDDSVERGPLFLQDSLAFLDGDLWVFGAVTMSSGRPTTQAQGYEVDPETLSVIRTLPLPPAMPADGIMALAAGPEGTLWIGYSQNLLRVDVATGHILDEITAPSGLIVSDVAVDPTGRFLYVSYAHNVGGPTEGAEEGAVVYEYDAVSGRELVDTVGGPVIGSVAGANLVAVPGGVWVSFRTGMAGLTVFLRQSDLAVSAGATSDSTIGSPFAWMMDASVAYGDGTLFLAQEGGLVACIDAQTGEVRGTETLPNSAEEDGVITVLAVNGSAGLVYGWNEDGVIAITPPASCWS
jgi:hypothetical protein